MSVPAEPAAGSHSAAGPFAATARLLRSPGALLFVVTLALGFCFFHEAWSNPATTWKGDLGDPEQFQYFLAWTPYALGHGLNPFLTHAALYPAGANLTWNTAVFLPALVVAPVTVLFGPTVAYNVLMVLAPPVTALASYAAFRRWARPFGAAVGGLLMATCPFFVAHAAGHLHLMLLALVPLALAVVDEIVVRQRWRWWVAGVALGAIGAAQLLTAEEVLALDALLAVVGIVVLGVTHPRQILSRLRYAAGALGVAIATFVVLAGYPLWVQFFGPNRVEDTIHAPDFYVNDLAGVVKPAAQWLGLGWGRQASTTWTGGAAEWNGYLGIPLLVATACALVWAARRGRGRRPVVAFALVMALASLVLSFGSRARLDGTPVGPPLPWGLLAKAPLLHQVLPARFGLYADLFAVLAVAVLLDALWASGRLRARAAGLVLAAAAFLSWLPAGWATTTVAQPAFFEPGHGVDRIPAGSVAVVLPFVAGPASEHAELWQARSGFRFTMPEGYLIVPGPHYGPATATYQAFGSHPLVSDNLPQWLAVSVREEWRHWRVSTVVVGPGPYDEQMVVALVEQVVRRAPVWEDGIAVFEHVTR